jgi:hypothetical protein
MSHNKMVKLVDRMQELHRKLGEAEVPTDTGCIKPGSNNRRNQAQGRVFCPAFFIYFLRAFSTVRYTIIIEADISETLFAGER